MTRMFRRALAALCLSAAMTAPGVAGAQSAPLPYTLISRVMEANARVTAIAIDMGRDLPINWKLEQAFAVSAELQPVKTYAGDVIANSAAAKAPRRILKAYTSAKPETGGPSQGRYVILELDPDDFNASSWYAGFNPSIRQMLPYRDRMTYEVRLLHDLNLVAPPVSPTKPGATVETVKAGTAFRQAGARVATADLFTQGVFQQPANPQTKAIAYNLYTPAGVPAGAKLPLVVFLHGSGQSHDYAAFPNDLSADVLSPLLANQGGVAWVERGPEKAYVLVPQAPARDTSDPEGEAGWSSADTQKLLLGLVDQVIADHPAIDTRRLYLTGLSMGAVGSWKILMNPNPAISRKFAAAALFNGIPIKLSALRTQAGETPVQYVPRIAEVVRGGDFRQVAVPIWLGHADTDPVVSSVGSRIPFAMLTGQATVDGTGALQAAAGVMKSATPLVRHYEAPNRTHGTEVRYTEYQYGNGERLLDLGMVTRNGHFSWEASFKDQAMIDWLFRQARKDPN